MVLELLVFALGETPALFAILSPYRASLPTCQEKLLFIDLSGSCFGFSFSMVILFFSF